jgi:hypothetical protein
MSSSPRDGSGRRAASSNSRTRCSSALRTTLFSLGFVLRSLAYRVIEVPRCPKNDSILQIRGYLSPGTARGLTVAGAGVGPTSYGL